MKRSVLLVSLLVIALVAFASVASAQQASVFGNGVLVRAFITETGGICSNDPATACTSASDCGGICDPRYSAYLEVRDETGSILPITDFTVTADLGTTPPVVAANPFRIHNNDLVNNDITLSYDSLANRMYVFCTNEAHGLHVMAYNISLNTPVNGACVTYSQGLTQVPTNLCTVGTASGVSGSGPWSWICYGANGGQNASCTAQKKVYGACGSSNGQTFTSAPTSNLCNAGTASSVTGSGPWNWSCTGSYGGDTASCSANKQTSGTADLTPTYFKAPAAGSNGLGFSATATVANLGTSSAGPFNVKIYMGGQLLVNGTKTVSTLGAGSSVSLSFSNLKFSGLSLHTYYQIKVVVDADSEVGETNEDNNIKSRDYEVL